LVLRVLHQEIDAAGVRHHHDARGRVDLEVIADVAQAVGRLHQSFAEVVHDLVLR
jgi:hypothetical protein